MNKIVIDTNVLISALRSSRGASFKLLSLVGTGRFEICLSVPLLLEYEMVCKRQKFNYITDSDIDDLLDYLCKVADNRSIFYLWRPFLRDPKDDMILELAVESHSKCVITYNLNDFNGIEEFGIQPMNPQEYLKKIGEL